MQPIIIQCFRDVLNFTSRLFAYLQILVDLRFAVHKYYMNIQEHDSLVVIYQNCGKGHTLRPRRSLTSIISCFSCWRVISFASAVLSRVLMAANLRPLPRPVARPHSAASGSPQWYRLYSACGAALGQVHCFKGLFLVIVFSCGVSVNLLVNV